MTLEGAESGQIEILKDIQETEDVIDLVLQEGYQQEELEEVKENGLAASSQGSEEIYLTEDGEALLEDDTSANYGEMDFNELSFDDLSLAEEEVLKELLDDPDDVAERVRVSPVTVDNYEEHLIGKDYLERDGDEYTPGEKILDLVEDIGEDSEEPAPEFTEWSENEREVLEEWSENEELIRSILKSEYREQLENYRNGEREEIDAEGHRLIESGETSSDKESESGISNKELGDSTGWAPFIVTFSAWDAYKNIFLNGEENGYIDESDIDLSTGGKDPGAIRWRSERDDFEEKYGSEALPLEDIGPVFRDEGTYRDGLIRETKKMLNKHGGDMEKTEFYEELGWDYDKADRALREAAGAGILEVYGQGNNGGIALTKEHYEPRIREFSNM